MPPRFKPRFKPRSKSAIYKAALRREVVDEPRQVLPLSTRAERRQSDSLVTAVDEVGHTFVVVDGTIW